MLENLIDISTYKKKTKDTFFFQVPNAFMRNSHLNLQEKSFYIYLNGFGDKCFQNQSVICKELSISKPTLRKLMTSLEEKNYIYVQRKFSSKTKEKATPIIFPLPLDENTGLLTSYHEQIISHLRNNYPSDY